MKKILYTLLAAAAVLCSVSCNKFPHEGTATENIAGSWLCTVYYANGTEWAAYVAADYLTHNTAANLATEMWIDGSWYIGSTYETKCKIDADPANCTFGSNGKEYQDIYSSLPKISLPIKLFGKEVPQKIFGGKVTKKGAVAPGSESEVDKIEFYIHFSDDDAYGTLFYVVGYKYTGFPEDEENYKMDWELPAVPVL